MLLQGIHNSEKEIYSVGALICRMYFLKLFLGCYFLHGTRLQIQWKNFTESYVSSTIHTVRCILFVYNTKVLFVSNF